jgi:hypothetical protein
MSKTGYKNQFEGRLSDFVRRILHEAGDGLPTIRFIKKDATNGPYVNPKRQGIGTDQFINLMVDEDELSLRAVFELPGGGSASSNAYIVPDQAAADALTGLEAGDLVFIQDNGTGNWSFQIVEAPADGTYPAATITNIINQDSIAQAVVGLLSYMGGYDANLNVPNLTGANTFKTGDTWTVTVAGTFFGENMEVGDMLIAEVDSPAALTDWTRVNKNIDLTQAQQDAIQNANAPTGLNPFATIADLAGLETHFLIVDDLAALNALTGLKVGNVVYVKNLGGGLNPFRVVIYDVSGGTNFPQTKHTYFSYEAGGRVVKNESTADLATNFTGGNNVPIPLVTRLAGTGLQQALNVTAVNEDFTQFLAVNDPLQFGRNADDPKFNYEYTATFSVRSSNSGSVYEFHFVQKAGAVVSVQIDSVRWQPDSSNRPHTITMTFQTNRAFNEKVGVYVERTQGGGILTTERFSLTQKYIGQRGYY